MGLDHFRPYHVIWGYKKFFRPKIFTNFFLWFWDDSCGICSFYRFEIFQGFYRWTEFILTGQVPGFSNLGSSGEIRQNKNPSQTPSYSWKNNYFINIFYHIKYQIFQNDGQVENFSRKLRESKTKFTKWRFPEGHWNLYTELLKSKYMNLSITMVFKFSNLTHILKILRKKCRKFGTILEIYVVYENRTSKIKFFLVSMNFLHELWFQKLV